MTDPAAPHLFLDVSSLSRWTGPPVGIVRVEHALARVARQRPRTTLSVWDKRAGQIRRLDPAWADTVLGWGGRIDVPEPRQSLLSRQRWFSALERLRLTRTSVAPLAERAQDALLALRPHGHRLRDAAGHRIAHVPADMALGPAETPGPGDVLLSAGSDWFHLDAAALSALKRRHGFRTACLCYDLIPITHPHFYRAADVALVTAHWHATLPVADLVIATSRAVAGDIARICADAGIAPPEIAILPLGFDPPPESTAPPLPPLAPGRYAVFVSTIEPRKGHATLLRAWRRLLADGLPQARDIRLVFVGRPGWMVDDVLAAIPATERVLHLQGLDDAALHAVYAHAAFALYPSQYEGFGLPVIEALAHGTPVLASTGGALPEVAGAGTVLLPPGDDAAWAAAMAAWFIAPPPPPQPPAAPAWTQAASAILDRAGRTIARVPSR